MIEVLYLESHVDALMQIENWIVSQSSKNRITVKS